MGNATHGWFMLYKSKNGQWYFNLEAENDEVIATSEMYQTRQGALNGIAAVRRVAVDAVTVDTTAYSNV